MGPRIARGRTTAKSRRSLELLERAGRAYKRTSVPKKGIGLDVTVLWEEFPYSFVRVPKRKY